MAAIVASAVNIHHFILDGAIWKLRNLRIANVSIRSQASEPGAAVARSGWTRRLVWGTAVVGLAIGVFELWECRVAFPGSLARGVLDRTSGASDGAMRIAPGARGHANDLAWVLATAPDARLREPDAAILLARSVVEAKSPPDPNALDTLAAADAAAGRFEDATAGALRAAELAAAQGRKALRDDIARQLALYRGRRPFVDAPPSG